MYEFQKKIPEIQYWLRNSREALHFWQVHLKFDLDSEFQRDTTDKSHRSGGIHVLLCPAEIAFHEDPTKM